MPYLDQQPAFENRSQLTLAPIKRFTKSNCPLALRNLATIMIIPPRELYISQRTLSKEAVPSVSEDTPGDCGACSEA